MIPFRCITLLTALILLGQCASVRTIQPPRFDYNRLISKFLENNPEGHFPLTVQRGNNTDPAASSNGYLFYASDVDGSSDIWMRDLSSTVNVPVVRHPAEQTDPYITPDGTILAYVSFELDAGGDIRIVALEPEYIVEAALDGEDPPNLWTSSINLSRYLDSVGEKLGPGCKGSFAEKDPVLSPNGDTIYFVSDRCNPGVYRIWSLELEEQESEALPVPITEENSLQPSVSADGKFITYLIRASDGIPHIEILDRTSGMRHRVPLEPGPQRNPYLYFRPSLSADGQTLYYGVVREDTNRNGILDQADRASVAGISVKDVISNRPIPERFRLIESSVPIYSLAFSGFEQGTILYAADLYNTVNIYVTPRSGMIPGQPRVDQQYALADDYDEYPDRYALALEAVRLYHSESPHFFLFEGKSLLKLRTALKKAGAQDEAQSVDRRIAKALQDNPMVELDRNLYSVPRSPATRAAILQNALNSVPSRLSEEKRKIASPYLLEELARAQKDSGNPQGALLTLEKLNRDYPDYFRKYEASTLQGELALSTRKRIPEIFRTLLNDQELPGSIREKILSSIFSEFEGMLPANGLAAIDSLLPESQKSIESALNIARGRLLHNDRQYEKAIEASRKGLEGVPEKTGLFLRGWQTIAFAEESLQNSTAAYSAKLMYGGSYTPDSGVDISAQEFQGIVEDSEQIIRTYRDTARSIYVDLEERSERRFGVGLAVVELDLSRESLSLKLSDREVLRDFCAPDSSAMPLLRSLGIPDYLRQYQNFCSSNQDFFSGKTVDLPFQDAQVAADLLYLSSYANANSMNILFLFVKKADLFPALYKRKAVFFHRMKVDLAVERNKKRLSWERQKIELDPTAPLTDLLSEGDPFEARIFNEVVYGYRYASPEARQFFDHSLLYGYAYALVQKSVEREQFYDGLLKEGQDLSNGFLREKKEAVLRDLKEAEYQLQYILYVEPDNVDAYLLLGWLYQYVDERRDSRLLIEPDLIEQAFRTITGARPAEYQDGAYYRDLYVAYFPDRLYEKNIELYNQALTRLGQNADPVSKALLNLNLANNHFKLLNFKRASEHYRLVEELKDQSSHRLFSGYLQEALYFFNRGRSAYYEGQVIRAAEDLQKARQIFEVNEYRPTFQRFTELKFRTSGQDYPAYLDRLLKETEQKLLQSRYRLALISSLRGLALSEAGQYREAISSYREAEYILYRQKPQVPDGVARSGLLNFMAMSYQSAGMYSASDSSAELAEKVSLNRGLDREDSRYQPQTIGGRALDCILGYGEDFSVIGEGRTPYGFSSLRQYELSLGIQLENAVLLGDLDRALALIEKRKDVFESEDGDVILGKQGVLSSENQKALNLVNLQKFDQAHEVFQEAAEKALDWNFLDSFFTNFKNSYVVLFMASEAGHPYATIDRLQDSVALLRTQQERYREEIKEDYIEEKVTEDPDFSYDERRDDPIVEERVNQRVVDFLVLEGQTYYYIALQQASANNTSDSTESASKAEQLFNDALKALAARGQVPGFQAMRARLNLARTQLLLNKTSEAINELRDLADETYEYNALREYWATYRTLGDAFAARKEPAEARRNYEKSLSILLQFPDLRHRVSSRLPDYFDSLARFYIKEGAPRRALQVLELKRQSNLQNQFLRYPLQLANGIEDEQHRVMLNILSTLSRSSRQESVLRLQHKNFEDLARYNQELRNDLSYVQQSLVQARPLLKPFLILDETIPAPSANKVLIQFFVNQPGGGCLVFDRQVTFRPFKDQEIDEFLKQCLPEKASELIVIPDHRSFVWDLHVRIPDLRSDLPEPVFTSTIMDLEDALGFIGSPRDLKGAQGRRNIWNAGSAPVNRSNHLVHESTPAFELFAGRKDPGYNLRQAIREPGQASILFLHPDEEDPVQRFQSIRNAYEVFRASGGATVAVADDDQYQQILTMAGKDSYAKSGAPIFGVSGFDASAMESYILQDASASEQQARAALSERENEKAALLASRALSLRQLLNGPESLEAASILNRSLARLNSQDGLFFFPESLNLGQDPADALLLYSERIRGLYEAGQIQAGNELSREFSEKYPELAGDMVGRLRNYLSLAILESSPSPATALKEARLSPDGLESYLQGPEDRKGAARHLIHHGATDRANQLLQNDFDSQSRELAGEAQIQAALLQKSDFRIPGSVRTDTAFLLAESLAGRWKFFDDLVANLPPTVPEEQGEHRKQLLNQWKNSRTGNSISFEQLRCIPVKEEDLSEANAFTAIQKVLPDGRQITDLVGLSDDGETSCLYLSSVDRALMFHLLIQSVDIDPGLQIAGMLMDLINAEAAYSRARASWFALVASESYLNKMDPDTGYRFYAKHLEYREGSLESDNVRRGRLAVWYRLYDKPISDPLLGEFMTVTPVRKMADMLIGLPGAPDRRDYDKIVRELEKGAGIPNLQQERSIALFLLKRRAIQDNNWKTLANLEFYQDSILGAGDKLPPMLDIAGMIIRTIPENQSLTVLVDAGDKFYSIILTSRGLEQKDLGASAREMRANLEEFKQRIRNNQPHDQLATTLSDFYRSILPGRTDVPHYFWFPTAHALAPIIPRTGDQLYQVLDPATIAGAEPFRGDLALKGNFRVSVSGRPGVYPGQSANLIGRMGDMELSALENTSVGNPSLYHHFSGNPHQPIYNNRGLPFFLSDTYLVDLNRAQLRDFLIRLGENTDAPGLLSIVRPAGTAHAFFVKHFYDRSLPESGLHQRYVHAYALMIRDLSYSNSVYGYRLVTSRWIRP